jgi:hypothetical protein
LFVDSVRAHQLHHETLHLDLRAARMQSNRCVQALKHDKPDALTSINDSLLRRVPALGSGPPGDGPPLTVCSQTTLVAPCISCKHCGWALGSHTAFAASEGA